MAKMLVTGAGGFIGSHLVEYLVEKGHRVKAFIRYNSHNYWGWLEKSAYRNDIEIFRGDIRDYDSIYEAIKGIDYIFHLAALIGIPYSYYSPLAYIKTNIEGTYNVLQAARVAGVERVIHISTSEVYGTAQQIPINENHPINPQSPYSATKASADYLVKSFYLSFNLPIVIVRPFNTYGPRQSARAVIPTIITQALSGKKEIQLGNIDTTRDFNYISDTIGGMYELGLHPKALGEVINIGTAKDISISNLVKLLSNLIKIDLKIKIDNKRIRPKKSEVRRLVCDFSKARILCGWKSSYTLKQGLEKTIEWMSHNYEKYKVGFYNV